MSLQGRARFGESNLSPPASPSATFLCCLFTLSAVRLRVYTDGFFTIRYPEYLVSASRIYAPCCDSVATLRSLPLLVSMLLPLRVLCCLMQMVRSLYSHCSVSLHSIMLYLLLCLFMLFSLFSRTESATNAVCVRADNMHCAAALCRGHVSRERDRPARANE